MRSLLLSISMMFILAIFLTLSGCTKNSHETHKHDTMDMDSHKQGAMDKDAQGSAAKLQTTCPVMGGDIDKTVYTDYKGKRVYFCCKMCVDKFNADPEKYLEKL